MKLSRVVPALLAAGWITVIDMKPVVAQAVATPARPEQAEPKQERPDRPDHRRPHRERPDRPERRDHDRVRPDRPERRDHDRSRPDRPERTERAGQTERAGRR